MFTIWTIMLTKYHKNYVNITRFVHLSTPAGPALQFLPHNLQSTYGLLPYGVITIPMDLKHMLVIWNTQWFMHHKKHESATSFTAFLLHLVHVLQFLQHNTKSIYEVLSVITHRMTNNIKLIATLLTTLSSQYHNPHQIKNRAINISIHLENTFVLLVQTPRSAHEFFLNDFRIITIDLQRTAFVHSKMRSMHCVPQNSTTRFNGISIRLGHAFQIFLENVKSHYRKKLILKI